jgi:hypothetical protein
MIDVLIVDVLMGDRHCPKDSYGAREFFRTEAISLLMLLIEQRHCPKISSNLRLQSLIPSLSVLPFANHRIAIQ